MGKVQCNHDFCPKTSMRNSIYCFFHSIGLTNAEKKLTKVTNGDGK